jgi:hypothetical protein
LSLLSEIEGPCQRCRAHPASVRHGESVMDVVHGHYRLLCDCCSHAEGLRQCEDAAARIPEIREKLLAACPGQPKLNHGLVGENDQLRSELQRVWEMAHAFVCTKRYYPQMAGSDHESGEQCHYPKPAMLRRKI